MNTGCAYTIGKTHKVCQDYARCGKNFVILSDGCSSSPDSDFGSRLLVAAASSFIEMFPDMGERFYDSVIATAYSSSKIIGDISEFALDATLMSALFDKEKNEIRVSTWGDGVIAAHNKITNRLEYCVQSFPDGYPYFLSYGLDPFRHQGYIQSGYGQRVRIEYEYTLKNVDKDGSLVPIDLLESDIPRDNLVFSCEVYDFVAIMSDGVETFYQLENTGTSKSSRDIDLATIMHSLLAFKNFGGPFVQRRLNKFLVDCEKENTYCADDVSIGVIYTG